MSKFLKIISLAFLLLPLSVLAADATFTAGKDYEVIPNTAAPTNNNDPVKVIEFFSYGCPWCSRLEPELEKWLAQKPAHVDFIRVPVTYNQGWVLLAKAYYTALALGVSDKITPLLFKAIHEDNQTFDNVDQLSEFFVKNGVSKADFESAYNFSPGIDAKLQQGQDLLKEYNILSVPTIVVAGKYKANTALVNGDVQKMMQVVSYLITKK